jgi:hypothetical protein
MAGQTPEVIVPVDHRSAASACGPSCGASCCDDGCGVGHRLRDRLHQWRGRFQRNDCCQTQCDPCATSRGHGRRNACDSCDPCGGGGFFARFRGLFHRDRGCCEDTCCNAHGTTGGTPAPAAEPLKEQPKKLPKGGTKEASLITPPARTPIIPAVDDAPALEQAPALPQAPAAPAAPAAPQAPAAQEAPAQEAPALRDAPSIVVPAAPPAAAPRIIEGDGRNPF